MIAYGLSNAEINISAAKKLYNSIMKQLKQR